MTRSHAVVPAAPPSPPEQLDHVRWIAGDTGSGKTTVAEILAGRFDLDRYDGDRAERDWVSRCSHQRHPHLAALCSQQPGDVWRDRSPEQVFEAMAGRHGETVGFLIEDLLARPAGRTVLVDYFGVLPQDLAPLLRWPEQAVFLVPTAQFRRDALTGRYADTQRARQLGRSRPHRDTGGPTGPRRALGRRSERTGPTTSSAPAHCRRRQVGRRTGDRARQPLPTSYPMTIRASR